MTGFIEFIRKQGVVGLAVGFMLGGAASRLVSSLVQDIVNPILSLGLGRVENLREAELVIRDVTIRWGNFTTMIVDFTVIALVVYFAVKIIGLDKLDLKKDNK
jgi:large conductance mechanosensitive channel